MAGREKGGKRKSADGGWGEKSLNHSRRSSGRHELKRQGNRVGLREEETRRRHHDPKGGGRSEKLEVPSKT